MQDNDLIYFSEHEETLENDEQINQRREKWSLLVVDDEADVHEATKFALYGVRLLGREICIESAYSATEARAILEHKHYDCILLDVIMETQYAGLELVEYIRNVIKDHLVRIILRTGQSGNLHELEVSEKYDIHDYKYKSELTVTRLCTSLISALRAFEQIQTIDATRQGLELILGAANKLLQKKAKPLFVKSTLTQVCNLLKIKNEGMLCVISKDQDLNESLILAATGRFENFNEQPISSIQDSNILEDIKQTLSCKTSLFRDKSLELYIYSPYEVELIIHLDTERPISELDQRLLELLCIDIAVGFDTASMFEKIERLSSVGALMSYPNKIALEQKLDQYIKRHEQLAVLLLDIDNFLTINWGLGYAFGDKVLKKAAEIIQDAFWNASSLGRISADVFCLVMLNTSTEHIKKSFQALKEALSYPLLIEDKKISLSMTIGVVLFPEHDESADLLLQKAGVALQYTKTWCQGSYQIFFNEMQDFLDQRSAILKDLNLSIENEDLRLYYKPKLDNANGDVRGIEVLIHWQRMEQLTLPCEFISARESSLHKIVVGEWILREACLQQCYWRDTLHINVPIILNVSTEQLLEDFFLERLESIIKHSGIDPAYLELEVSESIIGNSSIDAILAVAKKSNINLSVNADALETVSAIESIEENQIFIFKNSILVELIINLTHQLGLGVLADNEHIEQQKGFPEDSSKAILDNTSLDGIHYDKQSGILEIQGVNAKGQPYQVKIPKQQDHFVLTSSSSNKVSFHLSAQDNTDTGFFTIPKILIQRNYYEATLKKVGDAVYILIELRDLGTE